MTEPAASETRDYRRDDAPALAALFRTTIMALPDTHYSSAQRAAWASAADDETAFAARLDEGWIRIAIDEKEVIGFAQINLPGHLVMLYVAPQAQRKGVGRALMDDMVMLAGAMGSKEISAEASLEALPFFRALGFAELGEEEVLRGGETLRRVKVKARI